MQEHNQWPMSYLVTALRFLQMSEEKKHEYLVDSFEAIEFDAQGGVFKTGDPLCFMLHFCSEICYEGGSYENLRDDYTEDRSDLLFELSATLSATISSYDEEGLSRIEAWNLNAQWLLRAAVRYANWILGVFDDDEISRYSLISCTDLLKEYSRGIYIT